MYSRSFATRRHLHGSCIKGRTARRLSIITFPARVLLRSYLFVVWHSLREEEESATEETRHSSFNDLRHLLLARRNFMQQTVDVHPSFIALRPPSPQRSFKPFLSLSPAERPGRAGGGRGQYCSAGDDMAVFVLGQAAQHLSRYSSLLLRLCWCQRSGLSTFSLSPPLIRRSGESPSRPSQQVVPRGHVAATQGNGRPKCVLLRPWSCERT